MTKFIKKLVRSPNRYFWFGMRYLVKMHSGFAREIVLEQGMDYISHHKLEGDYLEFGVFQGRTFSAACFLGEERRLKLHYWAFDSFEGLPDSSGAFEKGTWRCELEPFLRQTKRHIRDTAKLHVVKGWFSDSLVESNPDLRGLGKVAIAWVDCDLYESTVPVLNFLTSRLQMGSLMFFDDWFNFEGRPDRGEQKACHEWLQRNPHIQLTPHSRFGWGGQSFIVYLNQ